MNFKEAAAADILQTFHNNDEFSEDTEICYNGEHYTAPVVVSDYSPEEISRSNDDYNDGIYSIAKTVYIPFDSLGFLPSVNNRIEIGDYTYRIISVDLEMGEIVLKLERYDE